MDLILLSVLPLVAGITLVGALTAAAVVGLAGVHRRHQGELLDWVAASLGLQRRATDLVGSLAGHPAQVWQEEDHDGNQAVEVFVMKIHGLPRDLAFRGTARPGADQPPTGDPHLDQHFLLAARDGAVGRLTHAVRHELERIRRLATRVELEHGTLVVRCADARVLVDLAPAVHTVVAGLDRGDRADALAHRVTDDPMPAVRAQMLLHLAQLEPERARDLSAHVGDSPEEHLAAGCLLDDPRRLFLAIRPLPRGQLDLSRRAARELARIGHPPGEVLRGLERAHRSAGFLLALEALPDSPALQRALLDRLDDLVALSVRPERPRTRPLLQALKRLQGGPIDAGRTTLHALVARDDSGIREAVVALLQAQGTIDDVPILARVRDEGPTWAPRLRTAARQAIGAIQARSDGTVGGLALAEVHPAAGQLSAARRDPAR